MKQEDKRVAVIYTNKVRRFAIVDVMTLEVIHRSGLYKTPQNCKLAVGDYLMENMHLLLTNSAIF